MTNKNNNNTFNRKAILLFLTLSLMLSACQTTTPNQAVVTETASPTLPSPTATSLPSPTPTPTPGPLKLNLSQELPAEMFASIPTPLGMVLSDDPKEADIVVEVASDGQKYELISYQVYTLVAPFFTVQDNITLKELTAILTGMSSQEEAPFKGVYAKEPFSQLQSLIDPKNPKRVTLATPTDLSVIPEEYWMIVPFEELQPEFKVISIDGISPLDDNFDPSEYSLSLPVGVRLNATDREIDPALLSSLLPESNYKPGQLTSLIMTGVTAMARDTAFVMSTEGVLYPGTNIRKVMRAADLTHISNEVSFFEDCP